MAVEIPATVLEAVAREASENRITCSAARGLATELDVSVHLIGQACNELGIKIVACELGCF